MEYVKVPYNLTMQMLISEFGADAVRFYQSRINERKDTGKVYLNPMKTIYIWATQDRKANRGYYSSYRGFNNGRKNKNHGRS